MNKYEITTQRKKDTIIQSALSLFQKRGFTSVTIKEIAALAQVSQVSIYNYFGSKEALLDRCAKYIVRDAIEKAEKILLLDLDFGEKIEMALTTCTSDISMALSNCFSEKALSDLALSSLLIESVNKEKRAIFRKYIEHGKELGAIDPRLSTQTILTFMDAVNRVGYEGETVENQISEIHQIHQLFLYGLLGKPE